MEDNKSIESKLTLKEQQRIVYCEDMIKELKARQDPEEHYFLIKGLQDNLYDINNKVTELMHEFGVIKQKNFMRMYKDEEIRDIFLASGLSLKNVCSEFKINMPDAHRWAHGKNKDANARNQFYMFCYKKYSKKKMEEDQEETKEAEIGTEDNK